MPVHGFDCQSTYPADRQPDKGGGNGVGQLKPRNQLPQYQPDQGTRRETDAGPFWRRSDGATQCSYGCDILPAKALDKGFQSNAGCRSDQRPVTGSLGVVSHECSVGCSEQGSTGQPHGTRGYGRNTHTPGARVRLATGDERP